MLAREITWGHETIELESDNKLNVEMILKSTSVSVCFRGISRLPSAFVFLR